MAVYVGDVLYSLGSEHYVPALLKLTIKEDEEALKWTMKFERLTDEGCAAWK